MGIVCIVNKHNKTFLTSHVWYTALGSSMLCCCYVCPVKYCLSLTLLSAVHVVRQTPTNVNLVHRCLLPILARKNPPPDSAQLYFAEVDSSLPTKGLNLTVPVIFPS